MTLVLHNHVQNLKLQTCDICARFALVSGRNWRTFYRQINGKFYNEKLNTAGLPPPRQPAQHMIEAIVTCQQPTAWPPPLYCFCSYCFLYWAGKLCAIWSVCSEPDFKHTQFTLPQCSSGHGQSVPTVYICRAC